LSWKARFCRRGSNGAASGAKSPHSPTSATTPAPSQSFARAQPPRKAIAQQSRLPRTDHAFHPALTGFKPDLIFISAGFDAFQHDPLAGMRVTHAGFAAMARRLRYIADKVAGGRLVSVLEGGYDLDGLAGGMIAVLETLSASSVAVPPLAELPAPGTLARAAIDGTLAAHAAAGTPIPAAEVRG